jgi:8-amino-7-oxononanoate synthase
MDSTVRLAPGTGTIRDVFRRAHKYDEARLARATGSYPFFMPITESDATEVVIDGRQFIMLGSNNYLGLTHHPEVVEAARRAVARYGTSCTGSRLLNGTLDLHAELETRLARFVGKEAALVFSTGYQSNLAVLSCLVGRGDVVLRDRENHASIVDGCALAFGQTLAYRHNSMADLERILTKLSPTQGRLVVTDGVFSMEGDIVDLPRLVAVASPHGARVMVDDSHALGVLGPGGRGTPAHFGLTDRVDLIMSSFSKSLASVGGFVAGDALVLDYVRHTARPFIFSASMPPSAAAAALKALDILQAEPWRISALWQNAIYMREQLASLGYVVGATQSPIVPLVTGDMTSTFRFWRALFDEGIFVNAAVPPAVSGRRCLLRTSYMATHRREQLDRALEAFQRVRKKVGGPALLESPSERWAEQGSNL